MYHGDRFRSIVQRAAELQGTKWLHVCMCVCMGVLDARLVGAVVCESEDGGHGAQGKQGARLLRKPAVTAPGPWIARSKGKKTEALGAPRAEGEA
jgi:hypothetical protein|mmetsp:Transcript_91972/g.154284  ORF Transcript_91972/g.154284 Transcript_91972/m.154284 type:complete len:95 (-) Transcript_91972:115-399(-)